MRFRRHTWTRWGQKKEAAVPGDLPSPTASFRRRAWLEFQRALDPLAPVKPLPRQRRGSG